MKYVDYFIHPSTPEGSHAFYEARMVIVIVMCYLFYMTLFLGFYGFISGTSPEEQTFILGLTSSLILGLFLILGVIKNFGQVKLCGDVIVLATVAATILIVYYTGGPIDSPFTILSYSPTFLSFCLRGLKPGVFWSALISGGLFIALMFDLGGYEFPLLAAEESIPASKAFAMMVVILIIANLVAIYEIMNVTLRKQVDAERDKFKDMANIALESNVVNQTAESLSESSDSVLRATRGQKEAVEQLSTTAEELGATAEQNSQMARSAMDSVQQTNQYLNISQSDIEALNSAMDEVSQLSAEIQSINNLINEISYQTNLLSLNAMIEASRLSEESGFKVVALEVKKLAERSAEAGESIDKLLNKNQASVQASVDIADTIRERFNRITEQVEPLVRDIQNVADASHEQSTGILQMQHSLDHIDQAVKQNQQQAEESAILADELRSNSAKMSKMLELLKA